MRVTIICDDRRAIVNGVPYDLDAALFPAAVHAVQWYDIKGEVEFRPDANGRKVANAPIITLEDFQSILAAWEAAHAIATAPPPPPTPTELATQARSAAKAVRAAAVVAITVTVGSKLFDGDETSQTRMARAIIGMQAANAPTINWTLANNESMSVTIAELTEALILAGQEQAALWPIG